MASSPTLEEVLGLVGAMDAALPPLVVACVPESHGLPVDVEGRINEFMVAAKKIKLFFHHVRDQYRPSREDVLRKEIAALEKELKAKDDLMQRQLQLVSKWKPMLRSQKIATVAELEKVSRTGNEPGIN